MNAPVISEFTDAEVLRVMASERPEFGDLLSDLIDLGKTDEEIIALVCKAGGSSRAMEYSKKCLRAMRSLMKNQP